MPTKKQNASGRWRYRETDARVYEKNYTAEVTFCQEEKWVEGDVC
jgi:hypothetical protein